MSGISDYVGCPSGSSSRLGLSILFGIKKKGNFFPLAPDGACLSPNGLILDESSVYLGWTKGF